MKASTDDDDGGLEKRILALCDEALALPSGERAAFLARRCAGEPPALRAGVESLLQAIEDSGRFLKLEGDERSEL
jgi:hypothetical protein